MTSAANDSGRDETAAALFCGIVLITRRVVQLQAPGELTSPQLAALARLGRCGPASSAELATLEQITPQAMWSTLAALESRGLVQRQPEPSDGRRQVISLTTTGVKILRDKRDARIRTFANVLEESFTPAELQILAAAAPLIERLGEPI